jgi:hypothetical protein
MMYFPLLYRLQGKERYLIWISDETDSVKVDTDGFVPSFRDLRSLREYADQKYHTLETEEPKVHDLDWITNWRVAMTNVVDCEGALLAWNLFSDVAASFPNRGLPFESLNSKFPAIYRKLFHGNNLPSITPGGKQYVPDWCPGEISSLADVLTSGLELFRSSVRPWTLERDGPC